jgi:hypothetical protein
VNIELRIRFKSGLNFKIFNGAIFFVADSREFRGKLRKNSKQKFIPLQDLPGGGNHFLIGGINLPALQLITLIGSPKEMAEISIASAILPSGCIRVQ